MTPKRKDENSCETHDELVEYRLDQSDKKMDLVLSKLDGINSRLTTVEIKSGIWGAISGALAGIAAALTSLFTK